MKMHRAILALSLTFSVPFLNGCLTNTVWEHDQFARYHEADQSARLELFYSSARKDILVQYQEVDSSSTSHRTRAYWLNASENRTSPHFVPISRTGGLQPIPVVWPDEDVPQPTNDGGFFAIEFPEDKTFTLFSEGRELATFELPRYRDKSGLVKQLALTPPAVAGDAATIGALIYVRHFLALP
jgi:hypothetical protein